MGKRGIRLLVAVVLAALSLSMSALADMGPKPLLNVRVQNAPGAEYYLDLLAEGEYDESRDHSGIEGNYTEEEAQKLDAALLDALRAAVPDGWHACVAEGSSGAPMWGKLTPESESLSGDALHTFGYHGLPKTYRVIIVTSAGETWISDTIHRDALQSNVTIGWDGENSELRKPPAFAAYLLQFLATLLPTLVIEGLVLLLFQYKWKKNWKVFLLVNLFTQGVLAAIMSCLSVRGGVGFGYYFLFVPAELVVLLIEVGVYRNGLEGQSKTCASVYAVLANLASALSGLFLARPLWQCIASFT